MATKTIGGLTAGLAGDLDDTALIPIRNNDSVDRKYTVAQLRTQINTGAQVFTAGLSGITTVAATGPVTLGTTAATTGTIRLPNDNIIAWRNAANGANVTLQVNGADAFVFSSAPIIVAGGLSGITTLAGTGAISGFTTASLAGPITLTTAASRIIPGATSFAVRDTGNARDNLLVPDAGTATVWSNIFFAPGNVTDVTASRGEIRFSQPTVVGAGNTADFALDTSGKANFGLLVVSNQRFGTPAQNTFALYSITDVGSAPVVTLIGAQINGAGGACAFAIAGLATGKVRVTNNSAFATYPTVTYYGHLGF